MERNDKRIVTVRVIVVLLLIAATMFLLVGQIRRSIYSERKELLSLVTSTSATIVNEYARMEWDNQTFFGDLMRRDLPAASSLEDFIDKMNSVHDFGDDYFFFVDTEGKYYSSDGFFGKLGNLSDYSTNSEACQTFLATLPHRDRGENFLVFRDRLDEAIPVRTSHGSAEIEFFAIAHDLDPLRRTISELFPGATNFFVFDSEGVMLYKKFGIKLLIDGFNIYPKFGKCERRFGEEPEDLVRMCKERRNIVVDLVIDGRDYYFCSAPLDVMDWSIAFVLEEKYFREMKGSSFGGIIAGIALIALVLGVALVLLMYMSMKRKSTAERLKAKTDFLSNMSHDIRTPINGIMGMTNIALSSIDNKHKVKDCLNKIDGASHHLLSLVNDVLDMSRIESGKTTIASSPIDICTVCDNCSSIIRGQIGERDLDFIFDTYAEHTRILGDELHLRQVFINILGNAVKFTKDGGQIRFSCRETGHTDDKVSFRFEIKDTGIGMSKEFQSRIFEAFTQEENGTRTKYKGTGLGMSITKQLVDLMGGTIDIESAPGKGSNFIINLVFDRDLQVPVESEAVEDMELSIDGVKILLVEDNELNVEIATELLETFGAVVDTASDGLEAVNKFSGQPAGTYDVILMDVMMPRMNGLEATRAIRALQREDALNIPILAMTANAFDDDVRATKEAGMNAHLSKPIDIQEVIRAISKHVTR